jgi:hypothetical protein
MRFVLLEHTPGDAAPAAESDWGAGRHFDLMLEVDTDGPLATWRLDCNPFVEPRGRAAAIADHRRAYLTYEGPLTGGRGSVRRMEAGEAEVVERAGSGLRAILCGNGGSIRIEIAGDAFESGDLLENGAGASGGG